MYIEFALVSWSGIYTLPYTEGHEHENFIASFAKANFLI